MSTCSQIGIVLPDNLILSVYCHNDGYLSWVGKKLLDHYTTEEKVMDLMALGALSSLGETPELCFAYGRDRGDQDVGADFSLSREGFIELGISRISEFLYLFKNGQWHWMPRGGKNFRKLTTQTITD